MNSVDEPLGEGVVEARALDVVDDMEQRPRMPEVDYESATKPWNRGWIGHDPIGVQSHSTQVGGRSKSTGKELSECMPVGLPAGGGDATVQLPGPAG